MLLEEHLIRQKQENSRTSAWQSEQATKMEVETTRIREEAQKTLYSEVIKYKQMLDLKAQKDRKDRFTLLPSYYSSPSQC